MKNLVFLSFVAGAALLISGQAHHIEKGTVSITSPKSDTIIYPEESHFKNVRQLTFGGDNALTTC